MICVVVNCSTGATHEENFEFIPHVPTVEELLARIRQERNAKLLVCDCTVLPCSPLSDEQRQAWIEYRQALRDFTEICDLANVVWPKIPE
ncbi:tail fiber assembly protein [Aneurinibacillus soli]|uniref:tail fiber assembly protein n=1 Tax=Aneurinibacillus soli TaxID=1500254 RepID=UPI00359F21FA